MGELLGRKGFAWAVVDEDTGKILSDNGRYRIHVTKVDAETVCKTWQKVVKIELERFK